MILFVVKGECWWSIAGLICKNLRKLKFLMYYLKHEQQCFIRYEAKPSIFRSDKSHKTHTVNVLKIASKLTIDLVSSLAQLFSKSMLCKSRKSKLKFI